MKFEVSFEGFVHKVDGAETLAFSQEELEAHLDTVMEALMDLGVEDPAIGASAAHGTVEVTVTVDALELSEAQAVGSSRIRAAIHAAGGHTPGWSVKWCKVTTIETLEEASRPMVAV